VVLGAAPARDASEGRTIESVNSSAVRQRCRKRGRRPTHRALMNVKAETRRASSTLVYKLLPVN